MDKKEEGKVVEEDIQFTLICIIQAFFEQKVKSEELIKYFEAITKLVDESDKLIDKEITNAEEEAKKSDQKAEPVEKGHPLVDNFVKESDILPRDIRTRLSLLRKELVIYEMETKHSKMYSKITSLLQPHLNEHLEQIRKDKEEILYFMDPNDVNEDDIDKKLLKDHTEKLAITLKNEVKKIPQLIVEYAQDELKNGLKKDRQIEPEEEEKQEIIEENYDDVQEEW